MCPTGWSSAAGLARCSECEKGKYSDSAGTSPCNLCNSENNGYAEKEGSTKCAECPSGYKSASSFCIEASTDTSLPIPENIQISTVLSPDAEEETAILANISWSTNNIIDARLEYFEIQWSKNSKFAKGENTKFLVLPASKFNKQVHIINLGNKTNTKTLWQSVLFVRMRTISLEQRHSVWSPINLPWRVASGCSKKQFLDTQFEGAVVESPLSWKCKACPAGAYCEGNILYNDVIPLFGYWRVPSAAPHIFVECPFSAACLGAPNPILAHKYLNGSTGVDFALEYLPETCNTIFGFKEGSRLCHTCLSTFRRMGRDRCAVCPEEDQNSGLIVIAVLLLLLAGVIVVWMAIADAGKATVSEISRKIMFNYLQVSALAAGFPMKW